MLIYVCCQTQSREREREREREGGREGGRREGECDGRRVRDIHRKRVSERGEIDCVRACVSACVR